MKNIMIFLMILSFVFIGTLSAQGNLGFGIKGGLNMAKLNVEDADVDMDEGFKLGPTFGGFVTYNLNDKLAIQPEILYTAKGGSYEYSESMMGGGYDVLWDSNSELKMNWLDIPILVAFKPNDKIRIFAGPFLEIYLNGKADYEGTISGTYEGETFSESESGSEDIESDEINSPGFGLIFGGAYMLGNNLEVEARYALGLTSIIEDEGEDIEGSLKNSGIQVLVNYYLKK
jgi:hypothetical protein